MLKQGAYGLCLLAMKPNLFITWITSRNFFYTAGRLLDILY